MSGRHQRWSHRIMRVRGEGVDMGLRRGYGIPSQRGMSSLRAERLARGGGCVLDAGNANRLFMHSGSESAKHWVVKALLFRALRGLGRTVGTEVEACGCVVDVLDADRMVAYEVESCIDRAAAERKCRRMWRMHDVVFVDASKVPDGIDEAERCVRAIVA